VLSLPIYDSKKSLYVGFIDVVDILEVIVHHVTESDIAAHQKDIPELLRSKPIFSTLTVNDVFGTREPFMPVEIKMPLKEAMTNMANWKTHRLPVVDGNGALITILSQSRIVTYLQQFIHLFAVSQKPIGEINGLYTAGVYSITTNQKAIEAFNLIHDKCINGVAVVDPNNGKIVGNISATDLRAIGYSMDILVSLFAPAGEFIKLFAPNSEIFGVICVTPKTTFEELFNKISLAKVHRLYVIGPDEVPVGVITLTDIIKYVRDAASILQLEIINNDE